MYIDPYLFLPVTSSVMITCTYPFTADNNHLQKSTILISAICLYTGHQNMTSTQIFSNFVRKIDQEIIWNFCVIRLLYSVSAHNLVIHFIWFKELSYVDCHNGAQYTIKTSLYILRINPRGVVNIIGFRNDAIYEPLPGDRLIFLYLFFMTKCGFRSVHIWPSTI